MSTDAPRPEALRIARNTAASTVAKLVVMAIGFGLTPFIVHAIGLQQYGLWAVVGSLAGYLGLLDFGLGGAFVKFISEFVETGNRARARMVLTFGMMFYMAFGLVLAIPVFFAAPFVVRLFKMPPANYTSATHVFYALFALLVATMVLGIPGTAVVGMQRIDLASRNNFIGYLCYAAATVGFVSLGWGIWGVIGGQAVQVLATVSLQWITALRLFGPILHNPLRIERAIIKRLIGFGGWTQLTSILNIISLDVGRFISAGAVSVTSVSYYELGGKVSFLSRSMPQYLLNAIMPAASAAEARGDKDTVEQLYQTGTFYSMFATLAIAGFAIGAAGPVMRVWMGQQFPFTSSIILFLATGYAISGLTGVGTTILRAGGRPDVETRYTGVSAVANLTATALLVHTFGIIGVAAGTAFGWTAGTIYFLVRYHAIRGTSWWTSVGGRIVRLFASAIAAGSAVAIVAAQPLIANWCAHRASGIVALLLLGVVFGIVYLGASVLLGTWRAADTRLLQRATRSALAMTSRIFGTTRRAAS